MIETHACTFLGCGQVFLKAYELKKHKAIHDNPNSLHRCSLCDFFTLQKKNLAIHFATHTGEKIHHCPNMVTIHGFGQSSREERCDYKTNDPAALTKHRKKLHAYVPPRNRGRVSKATSPRKPRKPRQKQEGKVPSRTRAAKHPVPLSSRKKRSRVARVNDNSNGGAGSTCTDSPEESAPFRWEGGILHIDANACNLPEYACSVPGSVTSVTPDEEMSLASLWDPSLQPGWLETYERGYLMLEERGMMYVPEPLPDAPPLLPATLDMQTGRGGCLCPDWMIEAGIEGWDQSVADAHNEFYVFDA